MVAASGGDRRVRAETGRMVAAGEWESARRFDEAVAVARLMLAADAGSGDDVAGGGGGDVAGGGGVGGGVAGGGGGAKALAVFEARVADGVDVGVAATTARLGLESLPAAELRTLVDRVVAVFEPGGSGPPGGFTVSEWAWLPFTMRMGYGRCRQSSGDGGSGDGIRSGVWVPDFNGGPDAATTRVAVVAEFGRTGIDGSGGAVLADQLVDLALSEPSSEDLRVHGRIADAVADPTTGLSRAFFATLGAAGTAVLPDVVAASTHRGPTEVLPADDAKLEVIGRYGSGLAAVERAGELAFTADELFARPSAHSPASYFAGDGGFRQEFVVDAATVMLADLEPNAWAIADPRTLVLTEINGHGIDGRAALLDSLEHRLGPDYLDAILWPPVAIHSPAGAGGRDRHVVGDLLGPLIAVPSARPGLAADVVDAAARHPHVPRLETADVIQHVILSDTLLIAPEHGAAFGRPVDALAPEVSARDVVDVMERVFLAGSGGGLLLYMDGVVPAVTTFAYESGGLDALTDEYLELSGELVGKIRAAFANARLTEAINTDHLIENAKLYGASVATALGGLAFMGAGAAVAVVGGAAMNVGAGHVSNLWDADNVEAVLAAIVSEEDGQSSGYRLQVADTLEDLESFPGFTPAMVAGFTGGVLVWRNGEAIGTLGTWQDRISSIESRSHDHTDRYLRRPGQ